MLESFKKKEHRLRFRINRSVELQPCQAQELRNSDVTSRPYHQQFRNTTRCILFAVHHSPSSSNSSSLVSSMFSFFAFLALFASGFASSSLSFFGTSSSASSISFCSLLISTPCFLSSALMCGMATSRALYWSMFRLMPYSWSAQEQEKFWGIREGSTFLPGKSFSSFS